MNSSSIQLSDSMEMEGEMEMQLEEAGGGRRWPTRTATRTTTLAPFAPISKKTTLTSINQRSVNSSRPCNTLDPHSVM